MKLLILLLLTTLYASVEARKCRALAFSGGGNLGAYQAAVFIGMTEILPAEEVTYDVITGVSAGSLNAMGLSAFEPSDVKSAAEFIYSLWDSIPDNKAYGNWPLGIAEGLFMRSGIFDISPGITWIKKQFGDKTVKRKISLASVDANNADYIATDYNATYTQPDDLIESAFASSALPGIFDPVVRGEQILIDGGTVWNLDVASAIRRCKEVVEDDSDIIVDMILAGSNGSVLDKDTKKELAEMTALEHYMRGQEIKDFYNIMSDYKSTVKLFPKVDFRYLAFPSKKLSTGVIPLNFNREQIDICFEAGKQDSAIAIELGAKEYSRVVMEYLEKVSDGEKLSLIDMVEGSRPQ